MEDLEKMKISKASELVSNSKLPSLPEAFFELKTAINSNTTDRKRVSNILMRDPVMCARTLNLAKSAYFMSDRGIETIDDAVQTIGTDALTSIAMAVYVVDVFSKVDSEFVNMKLFWKQSIRMGIAARTIARFCPLKQKHNYDHYYIAAMLSRIGKLVLYIESPDIADDIIKLAHEEHVPKFIIEERLLGYTHADLSHELLKLWGLSPSIYESIPKYIYPDNVLEEYKETAYITHAAYYLQFAWFHNDEGLYIEIPSKPNEIAYNYLGVETMDLIACTALIDAEFEFLCKCLNLN